MKHSRWTLTRDSRTVDVLIVPEITQETADAVSARLYGGAPLRPAVAPDDGFPL